MHKVLRLPRNMHFEVHKSNWMFVLMLVAGPRYHRNFLGVSPCHLRAPANANFDNASIQVQLFCGPQRDDWGFLMPVSNTDTQTPTDRTHHLVTCLARVAGKHV